jgi:hypothetical protein
MTTQSHAFRVGELRPSQLLRVFGVGAVVDLPNISVMIMGLSDWDVTRARRIKEPRLLRAVQAALDISVRELCEPPLPEIDGLLEAAFEIPVGVPVGVFPRWMVCPVCHLLAPVDAGFFQLKASPLKIERVRYVHEHCPKSIKAPVVLPARFLTACVNGHMDDFPWSFYVHRGASACKGSLTLNEIGISGEPSDILITCKGCAKMRSMSDAFGDKAKACMPCCRGRRPHLRDYDDECGEQLRTILLGASNSWFPVTLSALALPESDDPLTDLLMRQMTSLDDVTGVRDIHLLRNHQALVVPAHYSDDEVWQAIEHIRMQTDQSASSPFDLKGPEWEVLTHPEMIPASKDFVLRVAPVPASYAQMIERVVLVERLREVNAITHFTRIISPGDFGELDLIPEEHRVELTRTEPEWVPASEVHGEGIFIQFREASLRQWLESYEQDLRDREFARAHIRWCLSRNIDPNTLTYPTLRYVMLHSFAHALMRQFALECGYTAASLSERIYSRTPYDEGGPMAGILLYTSASDSEGTLGGLVRLGTPQELATHIANALAQLHWCASDPLCAEHAPDSEPASLHAAACHACLFLPETSCERGNRYLDRSVLVPTLTQDALALFPPSGGL